MGRKAIALLCAVGGGFLAVPAMGWNQDPASEEIAESSSSEEVVCRRTPPPVGSRIGGRRICKTEREWALLDAENQGVLRDAHRSNSFINGGAPECTGGGNFGNC